MTADELLPLVYEDLHRLAQRQLGSGLQTLQATALVHEAWMRVVGDGDPGWDCRAHFFGAASRAMRRILVEGARRRHSLRRGGAHASSTLDPNMLELECAASEADLLDLDAALDELETRSPLQARIVSLRFFTGLTMEQIAELVGLPLRRIEREWAFARAWLGTRIGSGLGAD